MRNPGVYYFYVDDLQNISFYYYSSIKYRQFYPGMSVIVAMVCFGVIAHQRQGQCRRTAAMIELLIAEKELASTSTEKELTSTLTEKELASTTPTEKELWIAELAELAAGGIYLYKPEEYIRRLNEFD